MADNNQLNSSWLGELTNAHHDGTTQQIDDFAQAYETDNARLLEKIGALHQCRVKEDAVWLTAATSKTAGNGLTNLKTISHVRVMWEIFSLLCRRLTKRRNRAL